MASVRAVEDALKIEIPLNAQYMRNIMVALHTLQDNIVHFYHLSALDWVDITSALNADPAEAARIAQSLSPWAGNTAGAFAAAKDRLAAFVSSGKLGIFGSGYWQHPAMKLSPEINLIAFSHYLVALDYQRRASKAMAIIGGKDPHQQTLTVGGVATAINIDNPAAFNFERIAFLRQLSTEVKEFVDQVYLPDLLAIGGQYPEWFRYGAGVRNYLSVPEFPIANGAFMDSGGVITDGSNFRQINDWKDQEFREKITENTDFAWYTEDSTLHPYKGNSDPKYTEATGGANELIPNLTNFGDNDKYTWCKAPRYDGKSFQVGPLAQVLAGYMAGDADTKGLVDYVLGAAGLGIANLHSTLGRHVARGIRAAVNAKRALQLIDMLEANIASGDQKYAVPVEVPTSGTYEGVGIHEAPRGMLSHWIVIDDGKIQNYQAVVPSTWTAGPRDNAGNPIPYEASLVGNPVADETKPLEVIRTIHSFDPCIACAVHTIDPEGKEIVNVKFN
jgi:hydrogenase large subunit